jgi:hypothetical protein
MVEFNPNLPVPSHHFPKARAHWDRQTLINPIRYEMFLYDELGTQLWVFEDMEFESLKNILSLDTLLIYYSERFEISDLNANKLMEFIQKLERAPKVNNLGTLTPEVIKPIIENSYLSQHFDSHRIYEALLQLISVLKEKLDNDDVLKLIHALLGGEEALESFLDNQIAMKGFLAKEAGLYKQGLADVMGVYIDHLHNVFSVYAPPPLSTNNQWRLVPQNCDVSNLVHTNIIEIILYSEIVNNQLPKGLIKVDLLPKRKIQNYKNVQVTLKLFHLNSAIKMYHITYNLKDGSVQINENHSKEIVNTEKLKFHLKQGKIRRITGTYKKNAILVNISEKKNNVDYEKLVLGSWHSNRVINANEKEDGDLEEEISHKHKHLEIKYHVYDGKKNYFLVQKKIKIGDDHLGLTYTYKNNIPIPLGGTGYIHIKERQIEKAPPLFIPPIQDV